MKKIDIKKQLAPYKIDDIELRNEFNKFRLGKGKKPISDSGWYTWRLQGMPEKYFNDLIIAVRAVVGYSALLLSENDVEKIYKS